MTDNKSYLLGVLRFFVLGGKELIRVEKKQKTFHISIRLYGICGSKNGNQLQTPGFWQQLLDTANCQHKLVKNPVGVIDSIEFDIETNEITENVLYSDNVLTQNTFHNDILDPLKFIRTFFDFAGEILLPQTQTGQTLICRLHYLPVQEFDVFTQLLFDIPCERQVCVNDQETGSLSYYGYNALDFLDKIYPLTTCAVSTTANAASSSSDSRLSTHPQFFLRSHHFTRYKRLLNEMASGPKADCMFPEFSFLLMDDVGAKPEPPTKTRASDIGYDLTIIKKVKQISSTVSLYTTGVKVQPSFGFWLEIVPRSSIIKSGYMLANSSGIIDGTYRGPLMVALVKIAPEADPIKLPARLVQLIPRKHFHLHTKQVLDLSETSRGQGGFGSTNNN
mmetsp:Transcript_19774/g.29441  ORF Transcript_19774/g.29441 Transcript_19774/m.29441 type:complete len:391 (-) Transcript_19774:15-1187(-)